MRRRVLVFWAMFAVMLAVYLTMVFWSLPHLKQAAGGRVAFDLRPMGYDPQEARALLAALGEQGRAFYLDVQHRLDAVYPALLAAVLVFAFGLLSRGWIFWTLGAAAIVASAFDYMENHAVAAMLRMAPDDVSDAMIASASQWTILKSASASIAFAGLTILLLRAGWIRLRRNR